MARKTNTPQASETYEVLEPFSIDLDGVAVTLSRGERVAGDHPALAAQPQFFRPFGPTVDTERKVFEADPNEQPVPKPKAPKMMRAKRQVSVEGIVMPDGSWAEGRTIIEAGQTVPETHPIVRNNRRSFVRV